MLTETTMPATHTTTLLLDVTPSNEAVAELYARYCKPGLVEKLAALALDKIYVRAEGDHLFYRDDAGGEVKVLDLVGGFGSTLLGHAHPRIVGEAACALEQGTPVHSQGSIKRFSGELVARLAKIAGRSTGRDYVVTLANSGAEAIEGALKHAILEWSVRASRLAEQLVQQGRQLLRETAQKPALPTARSRAILSKLGIDGDSPQAWVSAVLRRNAEVLERRPLFLSTSGGFHGKTLGALSLTHNPLFRSPFQAWQLPVHFLGPERDDWDAIVASHRHDLYGFELLWAG